MPKKIDHQTYREELLDKSFQLMAREGYGVSMRLLAKETGVSTGTLYHYFPSKKVLFENMAMRIGYQYANSSAERIPEGAGSSERLALFIDHLSEQRKQISAAILLSIDYARLTPPKEAARFFADFFDNSINALMDLLELPEDICRFLLAAADGIILQDWITPNEDRLKAQMDMLRQVSLAYISVKKQKMMSDKNEIDL